MSESRLLPKIDKLVDRYNEMSNEERDEVSPHISIDRSSAEKLKAELNKILLKTDSTIVDQIIGSLDGTIYRAYRIKVIDVDFSILK